MTTRSPSVVSKERTERGDRGVAKASQPMRPMPERSRVANREWYPGLCTTCVNASICTFPRSADRPVMTCDEFEGVVEVRPRLAVNSPRLMERFVVANREWFPGLCKTCEKHETCTFPRPEGGVFNCEEFE